MKGIKKFDSQTDGLKYFVGLIINAANRGWFQDDNVKSLFHEELSRWGSGSAENIRRGEGADKDHCVAQFWGLVCLPILRFFNGVVEGGDGSMFCDFSYNIKKSLNSSLGYSCPIVGDASWYGNFTTGRFVRLIFGEDGSCIMYYDTGYDYNESKLIPKAGLSSFLNLPTEGDQDLSEMGREDFLAVALK